MWWPGIPATLCLYEPLLPVVLGKVEDISVCSRRASDMVTRRSMSSLLVVLSACSCQSICLTRKLDGLVVYFENLAFKGSWIGLTKDLESSTIDIPGNGEIHSMNIFNPKYGVRNLFFDVASDPAKGYTADSGQCQNPPAMGNNRPGATFAGSDTGRNLWEGETKKHSNILEITDTGQITFQKKEELHWRVECEDDSMTDCVIINVRYNKYLFSRGPDQALATWLPGFNEASNQSRWRVLVPGFDTQLEVIYSGCNFDNDVMYKTATITRGMGASWRVDWPLTEDTVDEVKRRIEYALLHGETKEDWDSELRNSGGKATWRPEERFEIQFNVTFGHMTKISQLKGSYGSKDLMVYTVRGEPRITTQKCLLPSYYYRSSCIDNNFDGSAFPDCPANQEEWDALPTGDFGLRPHATSM